MPPRYGNHFQGEERIGSSSFYRGAKLSFEPSFANKFALYSSESILGVSSERKMTDCCDPLPRPQLRDATEVRQPLPRGGAHRFVLFLPRRKAVIREMVFSASLAHCRAGGTARSEARDSFFCRLRESRH
jgi:hypothetical protein